MHRTTTLFGTAAALCLLASAPAQSFIRALGTLRSTAQGYRLDESPLPLVAANLDLRPFVGRIVELTGNLAADGSMIAVDTLAQATETFRTSGDTSIGHDIQFRIDVPGASRWYLYAALGAGMMPLESMMPYGSGTLWIDPASIVTLGLDAFVRTWQDRLPVPNEPALVGLEVWFQGAIHTIPGPLKFLNAAKVKLLP